MYKDFIQDYNCLRKYETPCLITLNLKAFTPDSKHPSATKSWKEINEIKLTDEEFIRLFKNEILLKLNKEKEKQIQRNKVELNKIDILIHIMNQYKDEDRT